MWFLPLGFALDMKRTRRSWQITIRVQFWI